MKPVLVNAHEVNRVLNYKLGNGSDWYGVKFEATLDLLQSSLDHFDVKLTIEDEGGEFDFCLPLGAAEERFLDQLVERIAKYPTFLDGTLTVLLWIEVKDKCTFDFPVVRSVKVSPRRKKNIDIIFGKRKFWTLLDLFQIQLWASTAQAGLHSRSATGMGVGGRLAYCEKVKPYFDEIRYHCDKLETMVDDEIWPLAKYREILFTR